MTDVDCSDDSPADARAAGSGSDRTDTAGRHEDAVTRDPGGVPFADLDPALLRTQRTSLKWTRYPRETLPLFVAEMDFAIAPVVQQAIIDRVRASDIGYLDNPGALAPAFVDFASDRWGWEVPRHHLHLATDVATGIVESLRAFLPRGGRIIVPTPAYPSFFEMLDEVPFEVIQVPLVETPSDEAAPHPGRAQSATAPSVRLDLTTIAREFATSPGVDAFLLCNPHNPHGLLHSAEDLGELARLAATHDVFVISDEIHAPLTHAGETFTPFAPLAAAAGSLSVTATSASKGWNIAGAKCSLLVAADPRANTVLDTLPPEVVCRASILGLHAGVAAFREGRGWLDRAVEQIQANDRLLAALVTEHLPGVRYTRPQAGYLAWLDFRDAGLGDDPYTRVLRDARVALSNGTDFGVGGAGHVRLNLACAPHTIREAVSRIARILPARRIA